MAASYEQRGTLKTNSTMIGSTRLRQTHQHLESTTPHIKTKLEIYVRSVLLYASETRRTHKKTESRLQKHGGHTRRQRADFRNTEDTQEDREPTSETRRTHKKIENRLQKHGGHKRR